MGAALGLSPAPLGSAALGLWVGQLASSPGAHPPEVSGVGGQLGFEVWVPSLLIWARATRLQVSAGAAYPTFTVQGLRGEGHQRQQPQPLVPLPPQSLDCELGISSPSTHLKPACPHPD